MNTKLLTLSLISCALAACGGGSGGSSSSKPGIKVNGITGINYQIGERSGVVTAGQTIPYSAGEQISFKLGKLSLATVAAKDTITLADFFPDVPKTAAEFRAQLRQANYLTDILNSSTIEKNYSFSGTPELHRISNIMQLLLALDHDSNPENGLDLASGNWATKLAGMDESSLPFKLDLRLFADDYRTQIFSHALAVPMSMDIAAPLSHLYQAKGIDIKVKPVTGSTMPDVTPPTLGEYQFNDAMQLAVDTQTNSKIVTINYSYDDYGHLVRELKTTDDNKDGTAETTVDATSSYSEYGAKLTYKTETRDGNGDITSSYGYQYISLDDKRLISQSKKLPQDDTADRDWITYSYSTSLRNTKQTVETRSASGSLVRSYDSITAQYSGDELSELVNKAFFSDNPTTVSYNRDGNTLTVESVERDSANNIVGGDARYVETFDDERLTQYSFTRFAGDFDSNTTYTETVTYAYDDAGRMTSCTRNKNGAPFQRHRFEYGTSGLAKTYNTDTYNPNTNTFDDGELWEFTYGDNGELLSESVNNRVFQYSDSDAANGVAYLIHELELMDRYTFKGVNLDKCMHAPRLL